MEPARVASPLAGVLAFAAAADGARAQGPGDIAPFARCVGVEGRP